MYSILCWILSIWEALDWKFCILAWFMHCQQGGEVWAWSGLLDVFRRFSGCFEPFLGSGVHRSNRSRSPVWPVRVLVLCTCWAPVWPVVVTGLTGVSWSCCSCSVFKEFACIRPGGVALVQGELAFVQGELFVVFRTLVWWFVLFVWVLFCLGCVEPLPLPMGSETCILQVILLFSLSGFRSLVGVSFCSFVFFFFSPLLLYVGVVNALIKEEIEDHVWFEDRWMVASLCDEWLTTLCGLILG
jgi:hypothetical protein